jgi:hypothetical protein
MAGVFNNFIIFLIDFIMIKQLYYHETNIIKNRFRDNFVIPISNDRANDTLVVIPVL